MTEGNAEIIILNNQKPKTPLNDENNKEQNLKDRQAETNSLRISIDNINSEIPNSEEKINRNPQNAIPQLEFNQKDIVELTQEIKTKLNIPPCPICQSENYSLFIPNSFSSEKSQEKPADPQKNINLETETIKVVQNIFFPLLICQQNHKICLICRQNTHYNFM